MLTFVFDITIKSGYKRYIYESATNNPDQRVVPQIPSTATTRSE